MCRRQTGAGRMAIAAALITASACAWPADVRADGSARTRPGAGASAWTWSGPYAGVNLGWGFGAQTGDLSGANVSSPALTDGRIPQAFGVRPDGAIGGGQIGYNWHRGVLVYGLEADLQASRIRDSVSVTVPAIFPVLSSQSTAEERLNWFGTVRGRFGLTAAERSLFYLTGGLAYGRVTNSASIGFPFPGGGFDGLLVGARSSTKMGWTLGGGGEFAWDNNWSLKAEYLYVDLGSDTVRLNDVFIAGEFVDYRFKHSDHILRIGINYRIP
jgi:outer membrane immunogenic protein